jgi:hypothetical protein
MASEFQKSEQAAVKSSSSITTEAVDADTSNAKLSIYAAIEAESITVQSSEAIIQEPVASAIVPETDVAKDVILFERDTITCKVLVQPRRLQQSIRGNNSFLKYMHIYVPVLSVLFRPRCSLGTT